MEYEKMGRVPVDPRVVDRIQRSPTMMYEQGSDFMGSWGGPARYKQLAKLPTGPRLCYAAILEGVSDEDQIGVVTGLTPEQVGRGIDYLKTKGLVKVEAAKEAI